MATDHKPYEIHPDALDRGDYAYILSTGEGTGIVIAGIDYLRDRWAQDADQIESIILTNDGKTIEEAILDLDKTLPDTRGFLWPHAD